MRCPKSGPPADEVKDCGLESQEAGLISELSVGRSVFQCRAPLSQATVHPGRLGASSPSHNSEMRLQKRSGKKNPPGCFQGTSRREIHTDPRRQRNQSPPIRLRPQLCPSSKRFSARQLCAADNFHDDDASELYCAVCPYRSLQDKPASVWLVSDYAWPRFPVQCSSRGLPVRRLPFNPRNGSSRR